MKELRRVADGCGPAGIRQVCRSLGASCPGGGPRSMFQGRITGATPRGMDLGRWVRCAGGVRPDLSN